jgi:4-amino-4-deoxy-L-arabinose transferase-like glycosyltransferase
LINDDARDYQGLATRLATTGSYADQWGNLVSLRPPLYPAAIAAVYYGFGVHNDDVVRVLQAGLSLLTVLLVYRIGVIVYSRPIALWAAGVCSLYPSLLGYANLLLSETLFTFLLATFTWLVLEAVDRQNIPWVIAAGMAMGLAALTRSIMLLFLPFQVLYLWMAWKASLGRRFMVAAVAILAFAVTIAPWAIRNTRIQKTLVFIDVMGGRNAMMGNYEYTPLERSWATLSDVRGEDAWHQVLYREHQFAAPITQGQLDKLALRHAVDFVRAHPWLTVKRDLVKFFNFWQLEREFLAAAQSGYFTNLSAIWLWTLAMIICGSYAMVLFAAVFGGICIPPSEPRLHWFLVMSILFPCVVHTLIFAHSRYHLPVVPLLAVYAAAVIVHRRDIWQHRRTWRFAMAAALCLILSLGWLRELVFVDLPAAHQFFV